MDLRVVRQTVQQGAVDKLRQAILAGVFLPGSRLPEANLCQLLGISRPLLREALRSLQAERLIEIIPNRGPQIPVLSWRDAEEIYEVREMLEGEAAARCAGRISVEEVEVLAQSLMDFRAAAHSGDPLGRVQAASEFYGIILRNCGNKIIQEVQASLLARINFLRSRSMSLPGRAEESLKEMTAIYEAVRDQRAVEARARAEEHVRNARLAAKLALLDGQGSG